MNFLTKGMTHDKVKGPEFWDFGYTNRFAIKPEKLGQVTVGFFLAHFWDESVGDIEIPKFKILRILMNQIQRMTRRTLVDENHPSRIPKTSIFVT